MFQNKSILTYEPLYQNSEELFKNAVNEIIKLPFTPSTILIQHPVLNNAIGVGMVPTSKLNPHVYFFEDNNYYPY